MKNTDETKKELSKVSRSTPVTFEKTMLEWFQLNSKRLVTFAGNEQEARKFMASMFYLAGKNPKLMECSPASIGDCLMQSAQLHLFPGALQECTYLPFANKKKSGDGFRTVLEATFVPMYAGLVRLAMNSGIIRDIQSSVVYDHDMFEYVLGTHAVLNHVPWAGPDSERGNRKGVYCVISLHNGGQVIKYKNADWIERRRSMSAAAKFKSGPWFGSDDDYDEMALKSILKYTLKIIPKTPELAQAIESDNEVERPELAVKPIIQFETLAETKKDNGPTPKIEEIPQVEQESELVPSPYDVYVIQGDHAFKGDSLSDIGMAGVRAILSNEKAQKGLTKQDAEALVACACAGRM